MELFCSSVGGPLLVLGEFALSKPTRTAHQTQRREGEREREREGRERERERERKSDVRIYRRIGFPIKSAASANPKFVAEED